jgi:hypothetical protein
VLEKLSVGKWNVLKYKGVRLSGEIYAYDDENLGYLQKKKNMVTGRKTAIRSKKLLI